MTFKIIEEFKETFSVEKEIFMIGTHVDGRGNKRTFTEDDLDNIIDGFDKGVRSRNGVPLRLGHSQDQPLLNKAELPNAGIVTKLRKQGGKLILHEITKGENKPLIFPVPWAGEASISFLEPWNIMETLFEKQGFETKFYSDATSAACLWYEKVKTVSQKNPPRPNCLGPGLVFGDNANFLGKNMHENFKNNAICLVEAVLKKSYDK